MVHILVFYLSPYGILGLSYFLSAETQNLVPATESKRGLFWLSVCGQLAFRQGSTAEENRHGEAD